jgi:PAS domain S-box-containing protein
MPQLWYTRFALCWAKTYRQPAGPVWRYDLNTKGTILVVEDTPADLELLVDTLTVEGYRALSAENGDVALASVAARPPELILLDIRLPGLDGFEVCRRLKARPQSRDIPIIFVSVSGEQAERVKGLNLGAVDYITKPFQREELLARIQTHLELRRLRVRLDQQAADLRQTNQHLQSELAEQKRVEEKLRASQQIIEEIINAIPVRVFWKDENLVYLGCNAIFARDAGFANPEDLIGKDDFQMGWRDQAELYRRDDRQVIESGCSKLLIEEPQTTPEGKTVTLLSSKIPLRGSKGEVSGVLGTYMDITEHKQAEEVLQQRVKLQDQLVHIAAAVPGMIYSLLMRPDGSTRMPYASGALMDIFDLQPKDVFEDAAPVFSLIHPDDIGHVMATIAESARTLDPWRDDFRVCHIRLGEIWVEGHSLPQREPDGSTLWHGFVQNITARKRAEERLQQSEGRMRAITDSAQDAILMMDPEGRVSFWNPAAERILGYTCAEALGQNLHDLIAPARFHPAHLTAFAAFLQAGQGAAVGKTVELEARRKDGQEISVQLSLSAVQMNDGWHAVGLIRDITARKRAEAERDQLIQDLQKSLANVKALSGLLPICAGCKKIRDDQGYWSQVESYVQKHSEATFTHGLCPDCIKKYYPELDEAGPGDSGKETS